MYALYLGPAGLVIISQIFNFSFLFSSIIHLGVPLGLSSVFPKIINQGDYETKLYAYLKFFSKTIIGLVSVTVFILIFFSPKISLLLVDSSDYYLVLIILLASTPFVIMYNLIESLLKGENKIPTLVKITILSNVITLPLLFPLIMYFEIKGAAIYIFIFNLFPFLLYNIFFDKKFISKVINAENVVDPVLKKSIFKIGISTLISAFMFQFSLIFIRKFSINYQGIDNAGIYQALLSLSANYFMFIYVFLSNYSLPKISSFNTNDEICTELNNNFTLLLFIIVPIIVIVFTYRELVIHLIFSKEFSSASNYIGFQLIGDIFRAFGALFGLWLIPKQKLKLLFIIDFTMNLSFILLPYFFINYFDIDLRILPVTYLISFFLHFSLYFLYSKRELHFKFTKRNNTNILISLLVIVIAFYCSLNFTYYANFFTPVLLLIWVYYYLDSAEIKTIINRLKTLNGRF